MTGQIVPLDHASPPRTFRGRRARKVICRPWKGWGQERWDGRVGYVLGRHMGFSQVQVAWERDSRGELSPVILDLAKSEWEPANGKRRPDYKGKSPAGNRALSTDPKASQSKESIS